jgi:DNA mismatch endonuclease, patch repair protein
MFRGIRRGSDGITRCAPYFECRKKQCWANRNLLSEQRNERSERPKRSRHMDTMTKSERSARMALIRSRNTKPEIAVRSLIHRMGYRYRLHASDLPGRPDLVFRARRKVIFVHGCFWHLHRNCPNCRLPKSRRDYWKPKLERNAMRDKQVRQRLRHLGWRFSVGWECELKRPQNLSRKVRIFLG